MGDNYNRLLTVLYCCLINVYLYGKKCSKETRCNDKKNKENYDICNYGWIRNLKILKSLDGSADKEQLDLLGQYDNFFSMKRILFAMATKDKEIYWIKHAERPSYTFYVTLKNCAPRKGRILECSVLIAQRPNPFSALHQDPNWVW